MSMVVTKKCVGCKHKDCVSVCPVEAFHEGSEQVVINPDVCTECEACVFACPEEAVFHKDDLSENDLPMIEFNYRMANLWPLST